MKRYDEWVDAKNKMASKFGKEICEETLKLQKKLDFCITMCDRNQMPPMDWLAEIRQRMGFLIQKLALLETADVEDREKVEKGLKDMIGEFKKIWEKEIRKEEAENPTAVSYVLSSFYDLVNDVENIVDNLERKRKIFEEEVFMESLAKMAGVQVKPKEKKEKKKVEVVPAEPEEGGAETRPMG